MCGDHPSTGPTVYMLLILITPPRHGASSGLSHGDKCLDAFTVALNQACDRQPWYTSTSQLQLASLSFCVASRKVATLHLRVGDNTPPQLLADADAAQSQSEDRGSSRVPRLRARAVTWTRASVAELRGPLDVLVNVKIFHLWATWFIGSVEDVAWPPSLEVLRFDNVFNQPIANVSWPPSLKQITFVWNFNQPVESVAWPASLEILHFGEDFDQPVESVVWPVGLRELTLGWNFNQPIELVVWPASLQLLQLGCRFNQPIARVTWPTSLQRLSFGIFDPDIDSYSSKFNQPIDQAVWPATLRNVGFGRCFRQSLQGLGTWMPNLEEFMLDADDYNSVFDDIEWPKGLKILRVGYYRAFGGYHGRAIPPSVEVCAI